MTTTTPPAVAKPKPLDGAHPQFRLRFKDKFSARDVTITARNIEYAERVGAKFCEVHKYKYLKVEPVVVAGEEILSW